MSATILRPAIPADAAACAAILRGWIDETDWFTSPHPPQADIGFIAGKIGTGSTHVAERAGETAGFMVLEADYLACLYLAPSCRGFGIGRSLLGIAKQLNPSGLSLWTFQANTGARRFYEREGFVAEVMTDGERNEEGLPDVMYVWEGKRS